MRAGLVVSRWLVIAVVCSCCVAGTEKQWPVKYIAGSKTSKVGAKLQLTITNDSLSFKKGKDLVMEISVHSITQVGYDTSSHNRGWAWLKTGTAAASQGICSGAGSEYCGAADAVLFAPVLVGAAVLSPFTSTQHFIRLLWDNNGVPSQALFEVSKDDYSSLLTELQRTTGKPWQDLPQTRKKLAGEIEQAKSQSQAFQLDRDVVVNETEIKAGRYQIVLLQRAEDQ